MNKQPSKTNLIVSGIQPSGSLHIGNYLGMIKDSLALQSQSDNCFYFIADLHSLSEEFEPAEKRQQITELAVDLLALGLDPKKSVIFRQSDVSAHTQLSWIFNSLTYMGELERMIQYKDKSKKQGANINAALFDYPVLMAADILIYKAEVVPVGEDQTQHLELARTVAKRFNNRFGETFPEPKSHIRKPIRVMSLHDPSKKMSKSESAGCLFLKDEPEVIEKKLARAVTATSGGDKEIPPGVANLFLLLENFGTSKDLSSFKEQYAGGQIKYQELKKTLAQAITSHFSAFRKKRTELLEDPKHIEKILEDGASQARKIAEQTLTEVKKKIGLK